jgi:glycogen(starch) synthase
VIGKVLMTTDAVGGVWNYSMDLCRHFVANGTEVALAAMGRPLSEDQATESGDIKGLQVFESNFKLEWMEDPWDDIRSAGGWLMGISSAFRPDVVHLNSYSFGTLSWDAPTVVVCHSCVCSWWESVRKEPIPRQWDFYRSEVRQGLRAADMVVAPTSAMGEASERLYGPFKKLKVIPNGRDFAQYVPSEDKEPIVFAAGRFWDKAKNIEALRQAAPFIGWPIYVAGEMSGESDCEVHALGQLTRADMAGWLSRASIYALPARYEPFGLSILEAALSGCALVLGDIPSLRENWSGCALFVDPESPNELAMAIQLLIDDPLARSALSKNARLRASSFGTAKCGRAYLETYREVIRGGDSLVDDYARAASCR